MKAIFVILFIALLCASATAQICIPSPFHFSHNSNTTSTIIPGLVDLYAGYQIVINGLTSDAVVIVSNLVVTFNAVCANGLPDETILYTIPDGTYNVPANHGTWNPSQLFFAGFQSGPLKTRGVCGENARYTINGATLSGGIVSSQTALPISIRFAYFSFADLAHYLPPLVAGIPQVALTLATAPFTWGEGSYCSPHPVTCQICLSLSLLPPGIPTYSTTGTKSITPSATPSYSGTPSDTVTPSDTPSQSITPSHTSTHSQSPSRSASFTRVSATIFIMNSRLPMRKFLKRG